MTVETGFTPDEEPTSQVQAPDNVEAVAPEQVGPPPDSVAGLSVLDAEPVAIDGDDGEDTRPTVDVRGRPFHLREGLPSMLLLRLAKVQGDMQKPGAQTDPKKQAALFSVLFDSLAKLIVPDERDDFIEHCEDVDPIMEFPELLGLTKTMTETLTGRPTVPPSQ